MPILSKIGALKFVDPVLWKKAIEEAMADALGRVPDAAKILGISERQLFRWLALKELEHIRRVENGLPRVGYRMGNPNFNRREYQRAISLRNKTKKVPTRKELRKAREAAAKGS